MPRFLGGYSELPVQKTEQIRGSLPSAHVRGTPVVTVFENSLRGPEVWIERGRPCERGVTLPFERPNVGERNHYNPLPSVSSPLQFHFVTLQQQSRNVYL